MGEIQVVAAPGGICVQCGNGLWGGPPCEHKIERERVAFEALPHPAESPTAPGPFPETDGVGVAREET